MNPRTIILAAWLTFLLAARLSAQAPVIFYNRFADVPPFIRTWLDAQACGKFRIAEPAAFWSSGCVRLGDVPHHQFVSAEQDGAQFRMRFRTGGFVLVQSELILRLDGNKVTGYAFLDQPGGKPKDLVL